MDCLFCKIIAGEIPSYKIWENDFFYAFLDIKPINLGHTLIVPKKHADDLLTMSTDTLKELGNTAQIVATMVKTGTGADGINLGMNNGRAAGQLVFHAHLHIIPRFETDGFRHWQGKHLPNETELKEIQAKITKAG